ncbi:MAG: hypothetical protein ACRELD_06585 [Longimicrobiales bacterium]
MFAGLLVTDLLVDRELDARAIILSALGALIAVAIVFWWNRRKESGPPAP